MAGGHVSGGSFDVEDGSAVVIMRRWSSMVLDRGATMATSVASMEGLRWP